MNLPKKNINAVNQNSALELLLSGLEATEELHYFSFLAKSFDFRISNDWEKTIAQISEDIINPSSIRPKATQSNLERLIDNLIISSDHSYRVYSINKETIDLINSIPKHLPSNSINKTLSSIYPAKLTSSSSFLQGVYLTKIKEVDAGIAFIFSYIEKFSEYSNSTQNIIKTTKQTFHTVFVPIKRKRIEVRVSNKVNKNGRDECFRKVFESFYNLVGSCKIDLRDIKQQDFHKSINSYYSDKNSGRAASVIMTTDEDSNDAILSNRRNKNYCARTQSVKDDSGKNHLYKCRAVSIRWPLLNEKRCESELSIEPHKTNWEMNACKTFEIKNPSSLIQLNRLVDNVILRAE